MKGILYRLKWFAVVSFLAFLLVLFLLGGLFSFKKLSIVQAAANAYVQVHSSDFTVESATTPSTNLTITLKSNVDLPHGKDDYLSYGLEIDGVAFLAYNGNGEILNIRSITPSGTSNLISIMIRVKQGSTTLPAAKNLDTIVIPQGAKISSPNQSLGAGIEFINGLTLIKTDGVWAVKEVETEQEEEKIYDVVLNAATIAWGENTLLETEFPISYVPEADVSYTSTLRVYINGILESANAVQYAGETKIRLMFVDYAPTLSDQIPCIRIQGGELTNTENKLKINVVGDVSFYEYVDGSWSTGKYVQVKETVLGITTEQKLSATDIYEFVKPQTDSDKLCLGWLFGGTLVKIGECIEIDTFAKRSIETEAVLLGYQSITGASIRYDEAGDSSGIRFGAKLLRADFEKYGAHIEGVGMIVMPSDLMKSAEFTLENYANQGEAKNFFISKENILTSGDYFTIYATIVKVLQTNYNREFCARAYLLTADGSYIWSSKIERRSVYEVATSVMQQHKQNNDLKTWQATIIETYLNGVAEIVFNNEEASVISSALSPVITSLQATQNGSFVSLSLTTTKTSFACITYNGKRIKNATQTYQNGILTITFEN